MTEQTGGGLSVQFPNDLTLGVHRSIVRARINWRFLRWSVISRDLDTYVSQYDKPLHQCVDTALATVKGLWRLKP